MIGTEFDTLSNVVHGRKNVIEKQYFTKNVWPNSPTKINDQQNE